MLIDSEKKKLEASITEKSRNKSKFKESLQSTKFEQRHRIFAKLSFRELRDSNLSGLHAFDNMAIIN